MRRIMVTTLATALVTMCLGVAGCGGGIEEGVPKDISNLPTAPPSVQTKMGPPSKKAAHGKVAHACPVGTDTATREIARSTRRLASSPRAAVRGDFTRRDGPADATGSFRFADDRNPTNGSRITSGRRKISSRRGHPWSITRWRAIIARVGNAGGVRDRDGNPGVRLLTAER